MLAHVPSRRALLWYGPLASAAVVAVFLAVGLGLALTRSFGERLAPSAAVAAPRARAGAFRVVALGDSITAGTGDSQGGYVARVVEALRRQGDVTVRNAAVLGADSGDLLSQLDGALLGEIGGASLVLVSIGGNDLAQALRRSSGEPDDALAPARANLAAIVSRLRAANAAPIRLLGLYNPFEILPGAEAEARGQLQRWNAAIETATHSHHDVLVVPIGDLFEGRPDRLAGDHFHPGPRGHAAIADRVLSTLPDR
jgi:lysophospholipase L1-like esterase